MESWKEELYHYGIDGMKWGIRRYQNPDGTLTEEGKRRYRDDENSAYNTVEDYAVSRKYYKDAGNVGIKKTVAGQILAIAGTTASTAADSISLRTGSLVPYFIGKGMSLTLLSVATGLSISGMVDGIRGLNGIKKVSALRQELAKSGIDATTADKLAKKYIADRGHTNTNYYKESKKASKK